MTSIGKSNAETVIQAGQELADGLSARLDIWARSVAAAQGIHGASEAAMRAAWNAAITEAADRCEAMCHHYRNRDRWTSAGDAADACKDAVRKLHSDPTTQR